MAQILTAEDVVRRIAAECVCRRARWRRHSVGAGSRDRSAIWRAIPGAAASAAAAIG